MSPVKLEVEPISDQPDITRIFLSDEKDEGLSMILNGECHRCEVWPLPVLIVADPSDNDEEFLICAPCVTEMLQHTFRDDRRNSQ